MALVSIVMPYYNASTYVEDTIDSILSQSFSDWELIIVNDCSSQPETHAILNKLSSKDSRIKVLQTETNSGAGIARNIGIKAATGRYLSFCDSDDWWYPNKLQDQISFMCEYSYPFVCSYYEDADVELNPYYIIRQPPRQSFKSLLFGCNVGTPGVIVDRRVLPEVVMPPLRRAEDWGCWLTILKQTDYLYTCPQVLWKYRHVPGSETANKLKMLNSVVNMYIIVLGFSPIKAWLFALFVFLPANILKKVRKHL